MQFTQLKDKSGNVLIKQLPYKSRTTALLFNPYLITHSKGNFGSQLQDHTGNFIYDKARIGYRAKQQSDQIFQNVGNYILQFKDESQRLNLFKNALQTRISDAKTRVSQYNMEQIAEFFPWVMSCQLLFEPLRSYMFCLANKISYENANDVVGKVPAEMINNQVNKAIRRSVLENSSLIEEAKNIYSLNNIGYIIKGFRKALAMSRVFKNFVQQAWKTMTNKAKRAYSALKQTWVGKKLTGVANFFTTNKTTGNLQPDKDLQFVTQNPQQVAGALKFFDQLATQIFKELRIYGQIVVNVNYVRVTGIRKIIDGRLMYHYLDRPNLFIGVQNSFLTMYNMQQNGNIVVIPQGEFTVQYLRKLVQSQVVGLGGRMFKNIKDEITQTKQDKQGFNRFSNKFLQWDSNIPSVSSKMLEKYNEKTKIKRTKLSERQTQRAMNAYDSFQYDQPQRRPTYNQSPFNNAPYQPSNMQSSNIQSSNIQPPPKRNRSGFGIAPTPIPTNPPPNWNAVPNTALDDIWVGQKTLTWADVSRIEPQIRERSRDSRNVTNSQFYSIPLQQSSVDVSQIGRKQRSRLRKLKRDKAELQNREMLVNVLQQLNQQQRADEAIPLPGNQIPLPANNMYQDLLDLGAYSRVPQPSENNAVVPRVNGAYRSLLWNGID